MTDSSVVEKCMDFYERNSFILERILFASIGLSGMKMLRSALECPIKRPSSHCICMPQSMHGNCLKLQLVTWTEAKGTRPLTVSYKIYAVFPHSRFSQPCCILYAEIVDTLVRLLLT